MLTEIPTHLPYVCDQCSAAPFYVLHVVEACVIGMISAGWHVTYAEELVDEARLRLKDMGGGIFPDESYVKISFCGLCRRNTISFSRPAIKRPQLLR